MTGTRACPQCGDAIAGDSPEGLCPRCLLQSGFADGAGAMLAEFGEQAAATPPTGVTTPHAGTFVPPTPAELASRFPQLEILELLGQGGMGAVYKARQPKLDRLVAVKILPPEWNNDPAFAERFAREAKALARLTHPHIVAVHDFGESDGLFFLVMEYVDGANLRHILHEGGLQPGEALAIIPQICEALQYAHEESVVHRDIKPENILLDSKGRVKIADFGLAKLLNRPRAAFTLTGSQQVMGTLDYMAPEQRLRPQEVDHRADIYSLGVVFYEMLTGELPLGRFDPPSYKAKCDARLDEVVFRALEREPARRYQRASQVKSDVESIASGRALAGHAEYVPAALPVVDVAAGDRFPIIAPAAGLLLAGVIGILFWTVMGLTGFAMESHRGGGSLFLLMPALAFPAGIGLILGAVRMMRCQSYHWALGSAIWAMLPWSPGWLIGLPCGIISLVVLRRPSAQAAFGVYGRERNPVLAPAIGIFITGIAAVLFWSILGIALFASERAYYQNYWVRNEYGQLIHSTTPVYIANDARFLFFLMPLLALPAAMVLVVGARRMMQGRSYHFAVLAALWAMVPWSPFWIMGLPFGILALRALGRRDVQLAFGKPFHSSAGAFERPFAQVMPAQAAPEPKGPARRGVRDFIGSMYSLMFHSRMEQPSRTDASAPVLTALPAPPPARPVSMAGWQPRPLPRRRLWPWVLGFVGLVFLLFFGWALMRSDMAQRAAIEASLTPRPQSSILMDRFGDLATTLQLDRWGLTNDVRRVFESAEQEYLALEARHTKRERKTDGHLTVTIGPFAEDVKQLESRFWKKLETVYERAHRNQNLLAKTKQQLPENSLFPFGAQQVQLALWRDKGEYHGKVSYFDMSNPRSGTEARHEEFSGTELPRAYQRFWTDTKAPVPQPQMKSETNIETETAPRH